MSRLTEKCADGYTYKEYGREDKVYNKLGELEDIEDEIDFPLDIAFRALKEGIYREEYGKLEKFDVRGIELDGLGTISNICPYGDCDFTTYYKDYKKSWWLREDKSE